EGSLQQGLLEAQHQLGEILRRHRARYKTVQQLRRNRRNRRRKTLLARHTELLSSHVYLTHRISDRPTLSVRTRPPGASDASRTTQGMLFSWSRSAQQSPATPAPMITTCPPVPFGFMERDNSPSRFSAAPTADAAVPKEGRRCPRPWRNRPSRSLAG